MGSRPQAAVRCSSRPGSPAFLQWPRRCSPTAPDSPRTVVPRAVPAPPHTHQTQHRPTQTGHRRVGLVPPPRQRQPTLRLMNTFQGLLADVDRIQAALAQLEPDEARLMQIRLASLYDAGSHNAQQTRLCPGLYWRAWPEFGAAMQEYRKYNKRSRIEEDGEHACPHEPTAATWVRHQHGPPRQRPHDGADTRRALCDTCGQVYGRDKKKGLVPGAK